MDVQQYVSLKVALTHGPFLDAISKRKVAEIDEEVRLARITANSSENELSEHHYEELVHYRIKALWKIHWEAIIRRLSLPIDHPDHLFLYARPNLSEVHIEHKDAAWDRASIVGEEHKDIRFESGATIYDVRLADVEGLKRMGSIQETPKLNGRPSAKREIVQVLSALGREDPILQKTDQEIAKYVAGQCNQKIGNRGWQLVTIQRHIRGWKKN